MGEIILFLMYYNLIDYSNKTNDKMNYTLTNAQKTKKFITKIMKKIIIRMNHISK
jgi:hypothetical protein